MSSQFTASGGTRNIQAGDTPTLDDLGVSVAMAAQNIPKGTPCYIIAGFVTIADADSPVASNNTFPLTPCVPTESKDNSTGSPGDLEIRVVLPGQVVALLGQGGVFTVGQYGTIDAVPELIALSQTAVNTFRKYARYLGKEAAIFSIGGTTPFDQVLSEGIVPDQNLADDEIGWFQLVESAL